MGFKALSNEGLIEAYLLAIKSQLDDHFLELLLEEIRHRDIYESLVQTIN